MGWTIHKQKKSRATVTQLDVVLAEGIARSVRLHRKKAKTHPVSATSGPVGKEGRKFVRKVLDADAKLLGKYRWRTVWYLKQNYRKPW